MKTYLPTLLFLVLMACDNQPSQPAQLQADTVTVKEPVRDTARLKIATTDTVELFNDDVLLIGDKQIEKFLYGGRKKFKPYVGFNTFKTARKFTGTKAAINYKSHKIAREYKTMITQGYTENNNVDFAGYYKVAGWGCGAPCQQTALVDMRDGTVYEGPVSQNGYQIEPNSRLYIINPPDSLGYTEICAYCEPRLFIWDEQQKRFDELLPNGDTKPANFIEGP